MELNYYWNYERKYKIWQKKQYKVADVKNSQKWVASIAPTKWDKGTGNILNHLKNVL